MKNSLQITAYELVDNPMELGPAQRQRQWMDETGDHFAYRCLPLSMANQLGWDILCPVDLTARWNGRHDLGAIEIKFHGEPSPLISSHFGHGVLTFTPGYLFRTTRSHNLWVKGPVNNIKDAIVPLEGLVETDWAPYSFTMNWKFTRKKQKVSFSRGEPVCRILPYPRHYLGKFVPDIRSIHADPKLLNQYKLWRDSRKHFIEDLKETGSEASREKWQRSYMKGENPYGNAFAGHETRVRSRGFRKT